MIKPLITLAWSKSPISEAYRTLRTNIQFTGIDSETRTIMITSAGPGEGKSSTVANLAVSIAQTGKSVLIIDADMRNPTQHKLFSLDNWEGLSRALFQERELELKNFWQETEVSELKVLTAGPIPPNPSELLGSKRMRWLLNEARNEFDMVIIDTPPVIAVADSSILSREVDGVILVLASGEVSRDYAARAKDQLEKVGAKILGVVLNKVEMKTKEHYYYYYYHGEKRSKNKQRKQRQTTRQHTESLENWLSEDLTQAETAAGK